MNNEAINSHPGDDGVNSNETVQPQEAQAAPEVSKVEHAIGVIGFGALYHALRIQAATANVVERVVAHFKPGRVAQ